jgi:hypothetical protein
MAAEVNPDLHIVFFVKKHGARQQMRFRKLRKEPFSYGSIVEFCHAEFNKLRTSLKARDSHRSTRLESFCDTDMYMCEKVPPPPHCLMNRIICEEKGGEGAQRCGMGGGRCKEYISINRGQKQCSSMQQG